MRYVERPASEFPDGMALSGQGDTPFLHVAFDIVLAPEGA